LVIPPNEELMIAKCTADLYNEFKSKERQHKKLIRHGKSK
jgi:hypothetical protein